jgi:Flp pilus assembly pilin Flp
VPEASAFGTTSRRNSSTSRRNSLLRRWLTEEDGQDVIEYALLATFVGFAAVVGVNLLGAAMTTTYSSWDNAVQSDALVEVPDPQ